MSIFPLFAVTYTLNPNILHILQHHIYCIHFNLNPQRYTASLGQYEIPIEDLIDDTATTVYQQLANTNGISSDIRDDHRYRVLTTLLTPVPTLQYIAWTQTPGLPIQENFEYSVEDTPFHCTYWDAPNQPLLFLFISNTYHGITYPIVAQIHPDDLQYTQ